MNVWESKQVLIYIKIEDLAEDIVAPLLPVTPTITREAITLGYAGVYSTFAYHAKRAASNLELILVIS